MTGYGCLYFGDPRECPNCGGYVHADGCVPKGERPIDGQYCSEECHDEALFAERMKAAMACDWCSTCGYDDHEHADDCALVTS